MRYYLDCEFNGLGGDLISLALVAQHRTGSVYSVLPSISGYDPWVAANVLPILDAVPWHKGEEAFLRSTEAECRSDIERYLAGDRDPTIIADWPDDFAYFSRLVLTGPGTMIQVPRLTFVVERVDAYPTTLEGAVQHNAWWDAQALRHLLEPGAAMVSARA
jgi:hypothetical protein